MGQVAGHLASQETTDLKELTPSLELVQTPTWLYDPAAGRNLWGNRAALSTWNVSKHEFRAPQLTQGAPRSSPRSVADPSVAACWESTNEHLRHVAEGSSGALQLRLQPGQAHAGFLPLRQSSKRLAAACQALSVSVKGKAHQAVLIQAVVTDTTPDNMTGPSHERNDSISLSGLHLTPSKEVHRSSGRAVGEPSVVPSLPCQSPVAPRHTSATGAAPAGRAHGLSLEPEQQREQRLTAMCDNHAMFQFLFDQEGRLLAANQRAMQNMREHLGEQETYTLHQYLCIGQCDQGTTADEHFKSAVQAIFVDKEACYRLPQLRWSKRHPGKSRWVLYEMWPLQDPITGDMALLVTEQNISQVKDMEEKFSKRMGHLEEQLQDALLAAAVGHVAVDDEETDKPIIDLDSAAEKTLQLLDKLLKGLPVTADDAEELREAILGANTDLREPLFFSEQLMVTTRANKLEPEVGASLLQMLSSRPVPQQAGEPTVPEEPVQPTLAAEPSKTDAAADECCRKVRVTDGSQSCSEASSRVLSLSPTKCAENRQAADDMMVLCASPSQEVDRLLQRATEDWHFDAFQLSEAVNGRPLSVLGFFMMKRMDLVRRLHLDEVKLARWLIKLEAGYRDNPYHNCIHAADVLRSAHLLCTRGLVLNSGHDDLSLLAVYLAASVHDYEHRGVNNDYLVKTADPLAIRYNDRSPQENHHAAASFTLLLVEEFNFIKGLSLKHRDQLRKLIIDMVLATDMKQHFAIHGLFQSKVNHYAHNARPSYSNMTSTSGVLRLGSLDSQHSNPLAPSAGSHPSPGAGQQQQQQHAGHGPHHGQQAGEGPSNSGSGSGLHAHHHSGKPPVQRTTSNGGTALPHPAWSGSNGCEQQGGSSSSACREGPSVTIAGSSPNSGPLQTVSSKDASCLSSASFLARSLRAAQSTARVSQEDEEMKSLHLQVVLKCADLGHLACPRPVHRRWVKRLEEELFRQGDAERSSGLPISPLMDRHKTGITKSQTGFFDIVALPMYQSFVQRFPAAETMLETVKDNYQMWKMEALLESHSGSKGNL